MENRLEATLWSILSHDFQSQNCRRLFGRASSSDGLVFEHSDIRLICCPNSEEQWIREILDSSAASKIQFVSTWREYDEVTAFLRLQEDRSSVLAESSEAVQMKPVSIDELEAQMRECNVAIHSLDSYADLILKISTDSSKVADERDKLDGQLSDLETKLNEKRKARQAELAKSRQSGLDLEPWWRRGALPLLPPRRDANPPPPVVPKVALPPRSITDRRVPPRLPQPPLPPGNIYSDAEVEAILSSEKNEIGE